MFKRIVVGYAGDEAGRDALALTARLAASLASEITVVYPYSPLLSSVPADAAEERVREEVRAVVPHSQALARATYHWSGSSWPIHALHSMASYEDAGLIVIGSAREGIAAHLQISLMERMVHGAPCAVLVAPAGYSERDAGELRHIGVGFTDSTEGKAALHLGHELAGTFAGELSVFTASWLSTVIRSYAGMAVPMSQLDAEEYAAKKTNLERAVAELNPDTPVHAQAIKGEPSDVLVAQSSTLDLLVLGSRAYGPLRHVLLGSVSAPVMREAHCPVLVVARGSEPGEGEPDDGERVSMSAIAD
jgi:nucleotide-binding universal stress UspA family protein